MDASNSEKRIRKILAGFKESDQLQSAFKKDFIPVIYTRLQKNYPGRDFGSALADTILQFAENAISCVESVIEKDSGYPDYRKEEEIERMKLVVSKLAFSEEAGFLLDEIHNEVKKSIVRFYPEIFEFSGQGFRLLELHSKFYTQGFISDFLAFPNSGND